MPDASITTGCPHDLESVSSLASLLSSRLWHQVDIFKYTSQTQHSQTVSILFTPNLLLFLGSPTMNDTINPGHQPPAWLTATVSQTACPHFDPLQGFSRLVFLKIQLHRNHPESLLKSRSLGPTTTPSPHNQIQIR